MEIQASVASPLIDVCGPSGSAADLHVRLGNLVVATCVEAVSNHDWGKSR